MAGALDEVLAQVEPPGAGATDAARARLADRPGLGKLGRIAGHLAGARHVALPPVDRKMLVVCVADHGVAGAPDGAERANEIAGGAATVNVLARAVGADVTVVDCGVRAPDTLVDGVIGLAVGCGTGDLRAGSAMSPALARDAFDTGVALTLTLAGRGVDLLALGQAGAGGAASAAAVVGAVQGGAEPIDALATAGGFDLGVLAGACVAAAAIRVPVVLDGSVVPAAALLAARLAPDTAGYLIAGHAGVDDADRAAIAELGLEPVVDLSVSAGLGAGAAVALPVIDAAARLVREPADQKRLPIVQDP